MNADKGYVLEPNESSGSDRWGKPERRDALPQRMIPTIRPPGGVQRHSCLARGLRSPVSHRRSAPEKLTATITGVRYALYGIISGDVCAPNKEWPDEFRQATGAATTSYKTVCRNSPFRIVKHVHQHCIAISIARVDAGSRRHADEIARP